MPKLSIHPKKPVSAGDIEKMCREMGLTATMNGSLKSVAENTHWHYKSGKQKGVLEITLLKQTGEIILSVHENRKGNWQKSIMLELRKQFNG